ncbi:MAG: T9SS type A sorting domain-containing protein [candidate division KSB1 bacterium]|nr:T9SS type A sorting domain-containing protein [candidate division KSB1 bacterium]MDZ7300866.1 T9SS type A sorting domain-containing protein [candidate division KSB1 bacterium]MDZ7309864.1 T9SS type A sorting domain-containing protein [candidate division KSB1 bacterium]
MNNSITVSILSLGLLLLIVPTNAGELRLVWQPNTEPDLAGYIIYYGARSGIYYHRLPIGNQTQYTITGLDSGRTYFFAVTAVDTAGNESVYSKEIVGQAQGRPSHNPNSRLPQQHRLFQNNPNPFRVPINRITIIAFDLYETSPVKLEIFDLLGRRLITLVDKELSADRQQVSWNGRDHQGRPVRAGVYVYRLQTGRETSVRKMVVYR